MTLYAVCDSCNARADANKKARPGWRQSYDADEKTMRHQCAECAGAVVSKTETTRRRRVKAKKSAETREEGLF